jgi:hypothetical protein
MVRRIRESNGLDEAILAREGSKCTVGMLYDIAFSGTKVDIYNEKTEDYLFYREYFSDVAKEAPEILDEAAIYISAVGSKTLQINVYSDYVRDRELPNWR